MNVVEGPRRRNCAPRGAAALCAGLAFALMSGSAWSANCIPAQELVALRTAALQQQLAVAALQCNRGDAFGRFVQIYGEQLRSADAVLLGFFKKRNMISGTADHIAFKNSLAKLWALSSSKDNVDFCANAEIAFRMANNATSVPLHAIAANIPAGRYVACAPGVNSPKQTLTASVARKTQTVSAEPAKTARPRILREDAVRDTFAARNRPMVAKAEPVRPAPVAETILPTPKPVLAAANTQKEKTQTEKKPAPVIAKAAPKPAVTVAAGPGVPLSRYAATMAQADAMPPRSPYEASPEELMTEADLPLDQGSQIAQPPVTQNAPQQPVQVAETIAPNEPIAARAEAEQPRRDRQTQPWAAEQYARPDYYEGNDERYRPREPDYAPQDDRYGNSGSHYQEPDYRDRYYDEAPRYRPPQRPVRDRYAYAPDYGEAEYDRYAPGYGQPEDRYYDPYYGR